MLADFLTPEVAGLTIIMFIFVYFAHLRLWKIIRAIVEAINDIDEKIYSLEQTCEELKSRDDIL